LLQHRSASSSRLSLDFPDLPGKPAYTLKPGCACVRFSKPILNDCFHDFLKLFLNS